MNSKRLLWIFMLIALSLMLIGSVHAQGSVQPFVAVSGGQLTLVGGAAPGVIVSPENVGLTSIVWSPDGSQIAYLLTQPDYSYKLMTVSAAAGATPVAQNTATPVSGFPITYTPEGQIVFITEGQTPSDSFVMMVQANLLNPQTGEQQMVGTFGFGVGCGGGSMSPADWQLWTETGFGGSPLVLSWTRYGLLHSTTCGGSGLALLNISTGTDIPLGNDPITANSDPSLGYLMRAVVSPDGERAATIRHQYQEPRPIQTLVLIDLASGAQTDVVTTAYPEQLAWGADGTLFYSIMEAAGELDSALTPDQAQKFEQIQGFPASQLLVYSVGIRQVNPATGEDRLLYSTAASAIGRMALAADGQTLVFSQIPNLNLWGAGIADGTLDIANDFSGSTQRATVPITLYTTPLNGGVVQLVGSGLEQFALHP